MPTAAQYFQPGSVPRSWITHCFSTDVAEPADPGTDTAAATTTEMSSIIKRRTGTSTTNAAHTADTPHPRRR